MKLSIIVAVSENGVIGRDNRLPWRIAADLKRFKALTLGHHLVMGRKTFESIGRVLPGRTTIVLSRDTPQLPEGVGLAASLAEAVEIARAAGETEAFVAGGAAVYSDALSLVDTLYLTKVATVVEGDTYFPEWHREEWQLFSVETCPQKDGEPAAAFETWKHVERRPS
ncbi:MAG: dihydrofolate reductase [bacterium]|nr:dihydrofolate reductase [bacterium]